MSKYYFLLLSILFFAACNTATTKTKDDGEIIKSSSEEPLTEFDMYQMSEMAALMEKMAKEHERVKKRLVAGDTIGKMPSYYRDIFFAKFTDEADNDTFFKQWAKLYITAEEGFYNDTNDKVAAFNNAVNVCLQCHQQKCGGPIPRIKKLFIKTN